MGSLLVLHSMLELHICMWTFLPGWSTNMGLVFLYSTPVTKNSANCAIISETAIPKDVQLNLIIAMTHTNTYNVCRYWCSKKSINDRSNSEIWFPWQDIVKLRLVIKKEIAVIQRCLKCLECSKNCCWSIHFDSSNRHCQISGRKLKLLASRHQLESH